MLSCSLQMISEESDARTLSRWVYINGPPDLTACIHTLITVYIAFRGIHSWGLLRIKMSVICHHQGLLVTFQRGNTWWLYFANAQYISNRQWHFDLGIGIWMIDVGSDFFGTHTDSLWRIGFWVSAIWIGGLNLILSITFIWNFIWRSQLRPLINAMH